MAFILYESGLVVLIGPPAFPLDVEAEVKDQREVWPFIAISITFHIAL
jgi:hypothetical protein